MALITCYDADGNPHQKEPVDAREACLRNGFTMSPPHGAESDLIVEYVPTKQELMAGHDQLLTRQNLLDDQSLLQDQRESKLNEREQILAEREAANLLEVQRLADLAATRVVAPEVGAMTKDELQAALKEKGIDYPSTANKAELVALLTTESIA